MGREERKRKERELQERLGISPGFAGSLALAGAPSFLGPLKSIMHRLVEETRSGKPISGSTATPIEDLAAFSREEVQDIIEFAKQQGVTAPILAGGPMARSMGSHYITEKPLIVQKIVGRLPPPDDPAIVHLLGDPKIILDRSSVPVAMHEIGHATPALGGGIPGKAYQEGLFASKILGNLLRFGLMGNILVKPDESDSEARQFAYDHAPLLVAATQAPTLIEEARASTNALRGAREFGPGVLATLKELAPAYGTYVAGAVVPALATLLAKKVVEALHRKGGELEQEKTSAAMPGQEVKAPGALRADASSAWHQTAPPKPKTTRPSTNPSSRAKAPAMAQPPSKTSFYRDMLQSLYNPSRGSRLTVPPKL